MYPGYSAAPSEAGGGGIYTTLPDASTEAPPLYLPDTVTYVNTPQLASGLFRIPPPPTQPPPPPPPSNLHPPPSPVPSVAYAPGGWATLAGRGSDKEFLQRRAVDPTTMGYRHSGVPARESLVFNGGPAPAAGASMWPPGEQVTTAMGQAVPAPPPFFTPQPGVRASAPHNGMLATIGEPHAANGQELTRECWIS